jgi:hypothetical protein
MARLPAYLVAPGAPKLVERRRGDADPAPDELALERTLWLDFDGRGYTAHDAITGRLSRGWRLEMAEPVVLGRVAIDGRDQLITRLPGSTRAGVELRQASANVSADSRIEGAVRELPAAGWAQDFASVQGHLMLPPGWRLLHASGVDHPSPTWLQHWSMLEIFLALITALAVAQHTVACGERWRCSRWCCCYPRPRRRHRLAVPARRGRAGAGAATTGSRPQCASSRSVRRSCWRDRGTGRGRARSGRRSSVARVPGSRSLVVATGSECAGDARPHRGTEPVATAGPSPAPIDPLEKSAGSTITRTRRWPSAYAEQIPARSSRTAQVTAWLVAPGQDSIGAARSHRARRSASG